MKNALLSFLLVSQHFAAWVPAHCNLDDVPRTPVGVGGTGSVTLTTGTIGYSCLVNHQPGMWLTNTAVLPTRAALDKALADLPAGDVVVAVYEIKGEVPIKREAISRTVVPPPVTETEIKWSVGK